MSRNERGQGGALAEQLSIATGRPVPEDLLETSCEAEIPFILVGDEEQVDQPLPNCGSTINVKSEGIAIVVPIDDHRVERILNNAEKIQQGTIKNQGLSNWKLRVTLVASAFGLGFMFYNLFNSGTAKKGNV